MKKPRYSLIFDKKCEKNWNSKAFDDFATAGSYRRLSTIYIKPNLFHQSNYGRDVELQNTQIVLFKPPIGLIQVSTLSAEPGLGA